MVGDNIVVMKNPFTPLHKESDGRGEPIGIRGTGTLTDTREEERLSPTDEGDHERFSHYVRKEKITEAMVTGKPVRALCGKKWVPSRDPEKFPICPTCKEIFDGLKKE
jgi:hypothetical protein